jgi:NAD(P)-dependent dehydrogenase (short-subunit alcohol dehydrogenase family)
MTAQPGSLEGRLAGRSMLVVGASAGLGRGLARAAARAGARLTLAARRVGRLEELQQSLPTEVETIGCDVRNADDCSAAVERAVERFGRLDVMVYAPGLSPLGRLGDTTAEAWREMFEINTIGAALTMAAAAPHLRAARGRALFMSSASARWPKMGLVPYSATKVALELIMNNWRLEEPDVQIHILAIGPVADTEFNDAFDQDQLEEFKELWRERGQLTKGEFMPLEAFASFVVELLSAPVALNDVSLQPLPASWGTFGTTPG